ncbi:MAG: phospho-N-acetylmuramoyl-pentapeptide-transferase [Verrucomicrobia bacterium]|nr:phospho-N-acetylmuramoyl-pentapeptide-transferase [Verrucomicrobiota bacterium]
MILFLYQFLSESLGMKIPSVFLYSSTRMMLAALTALLFTIGIGPKFIRKLYELKTGQSIRVEDCPLLAELHQKKKETPTMGGILILSAMLLSLVLWMDWKSSFTLILLITTIWLGLVGGLDDYLKLKYKNSKGLNAKSKFILQNLLAFGIALYLFVPGINEAISSGQWFHPPAAKEQVVAAKKETLSAQQYMSHYFVPFYKDPIFVLKGAGVILGILITIFVITGSSNAVNLTDGLDGLAAGCLVMVAGVLGFVAFLSNNIEMARYLNILYIEESGEIAIYLFALVGACLGFLWYNGHPAQVFMGDVGSLALGGVIGVCSVLLRREVLLGVVGGIFVAETLSVILQVGSYKLRNRKRIFLCTPLHHHFEYKGWPETKVVLRFWIISLILAIIGLASLKMQ